MTELAETESTVNQTSFAAALRQRFASIPVGLYFAAPIGLYLGIFFVGPLIYIAGLSLMPTESTSIHLFAEMTDDATGGTVQGLAPTFDNYLRVFEAGYAGVFWLSLKLASLATLLLLLLCYPLAYGLAKVFKRLAPVLTLFFLMPLFVSETIRIYGWTLFFLKGGILSGMLAAIGLPAPELMFTTPVIVLGLVNIYFPFMLFPLVLGISLVDDTLVAAARDLGASRLRTFWRVELPLAKPGLIIGLMLTFVLTLGSMSESQILGGQKVMMIAQSIDFAFSWQQDWPLGAAVSALLIGMTLTAMYWLLTRIDFDELFRRR